MTDDLAAVIQAAQADLGDLIELLDRDGSTYVGQVATGLFAGRTNFPPSRTLPKPIAAMIRESVLDAAQYAPRRLR